MTYGGILSLVSQYSSKGILVDSNILLLYFVGMVRRARISKFSRTEQFTPQDFDLLVAFLSDFVTVATTPNILTEVNSFINKLGEPDRSACYEVFAIEAESLYEVYIPSANVASSDWTFAAYGLTDCGIVKVAKAYDYVVLTNDLKAAYLLHLNEVSIINFNDLRAFSQR